jgi:glucose/arabinose dehydrogenase
MSRLPRIVAIVVAVTAVLVGCTNSEGSGSSTTTAGGPATILTTTVPPSTSLTVGPTTTDPGEGTTTSTSALEEARLALVEVGSGFDAPVLLVANPEGGQDLVVEQSGRIVGLADHGAVLDVSSDVTFSGEQGLLGLAFHPDFEDNRLAYVNYVDRRQQTVIEQFTVGPDGVFDPGTRTRIIEIDQPAANHNGGMVAFGPDGYLWIGMGDGGGSGDRFEQAQRPDTLLGAMLRLAVGFEGIATYAIPPDNPYANGEGGAPEVWATGLRNPWRFSFDGDDLWIADVGQGDIEEIDLVPASTPGPNFGWPITEGSACYRDAGCDATSFVTPIAEYSHAEGCSVTGGFVYRGAAIPELAGHYFYSDFCSGFLRSVGPDGDAWDWTPQVGTTSSVSGFGIGADGELFVVSREGSILRLERAG